MDTLLFSGLIQGTFFYIYNIAYYAVLLILESMKLVFYLFFSPVTMSVKWQSNYFLLDTVKQGLSYFAKLFKTLELIDS